MRLMWYWSTKIGYTHLGYAWLWGKTYSKVFNLGPLHIYWGKPTCA